MARHAAAVVVAVCLMPVWLAAQGATFTVATASANVHKGPSTGSAVIGSTPRGAVLQVTRELGSWVRIAWPDAPDGVGYLHVSWGSLARGAGSATPESARTNGTASTQAPATAARTSSPPNAAPAGAGNPSAVEQPATTRSVFVPPATHVLGVGGRMGGSPAGFGATVRGWRPNRFGGQLDVSVSTADGSGTPARVRSVHVEPGVLYSMPDRITDYFWLRPYVGSGLTLRHHSVSDAAASGSASGNGFGLQAFGGGEVTFSGAPQIAVSLDLGYHWFKTPVAGFDLGGLGASVLGHWYVK